MTNIPNKFSRKNEVKCLCGQTENMEHIYNCKFLSSEEVNVKQAGAELCQAQHSLS